MKKKGLGHLKTQVIYHKKPSKTVAFGGPINSLEPFFPQLKRPRTNTDREERFFRLPKKNRPKKTKITSAGIWKTRARLFGVNDGMKLRGLIIETNLNLYEIYHLRGKLIGPKTL